MHILVVNFGLEGLAHEDYLKIADELAPVFAGVPGLCSKVWLADKKIILTEESIPLKANRLVMTIAMASSLLVLEAIQTL
jgi:hypothetical protein